MKIIIDIPEKTIAHIRSDYGHGYTGDMYDDDKKVIIDAIYNATPLPIIHGRLIDEQVLADIIDRMWKNQKITTTKYNTFLSILDFVPTIIEGQ